MPGVHVAHFGPMCLTAWNSLHPPKRPIMARTGPTRFDAWSSWGGRPERTLGGRPRALGRHVACRKEVHLVSRLTPPPQTRSRRDRDFYRFWRGENSIRRKGQAESDKNMEGGYAADNFTVR